MNVADYFAMLGQPRQPFLDEKALEGAFHSRARTLHPDVATEESSERFAELNRAFGTLRDPRSRLEHLLTLEGAAAGDQSVELELAELFARAAEMANHIRGELADTEAAGSAIADSVRRLRRRELREELAPVMKELRVYETEARAELQTLNESWQRDRAGSLASARRLQQRFAFLQRWLSTLAELSFALEN